MHYIYRGELYTGFKMGLYFENKPIFQKFFGLEFKNILSLEKQITGLCGNKITSNTTRIIFSNDIKNKQYTIGMRVDLNSCKWIFYSKWIFRNIYNQSWRVKNRRIYQKHFHQSKVQKELEFYKKRIIKIFKFPIQSEFLFLSFIILFNNSTVECKENPKISTNPKVDEKS